MDYDKALRNPVRDPDLAEKKTNIDPELIVLRDQIKECDKGIDTQRVSLAIALAKAKNICGREGLDFKDWVQEECHLSLDWANKLATDGKSLDPEKVMTAIQARREKTAGRVAKLRERAKRIGSEKSVSELAPRKVPSSPEVTRENFREWLDRMEGNDRLKELAELLDDNTIKSLYGELVRKAENTEINPPFEPTAHTGPPDLAEAVKENNRAKIAHLLIPSR